MAGTTGPFDLGKMAFGGLGQMFDGIDSVKRAWSMFNAPSALVPTLDVDELDKRIADLKAVEQWLNLNVSMLHGTIQGLEIQRGTLAAVKAFGASFSSAMPGASAQPAAGATAAAAPSGWPHPAPASAASAAQTAAAASTRAPASAAQTERPRARSAAAEVSAGGAETCGIGQAGRRSPGDRRRRLVEPAARHLQSGCAGRADRHRVAGAGSSGPTRDIARGGGCRPECPAGRRKACGRAARQIALHDPIAQTLLSGARQTQARAS
jgi:pyruvate/2-oxoglutarate dehydrogenase complex dihydrolipoamide acyltransferase (E2) component